MHDSGRVRRRQGARNLGHVTNGLGQRKSFGVMSLSSDLPGTYSITR